MQQLSFLPHQDQTAPRQIPEGPGWKACEPACRRDSPALQALAVIAAIVGFGLFWASLEVRRSAAPQLAPSAPAAGYAGADSDATGTPAEFSEFSEFSEWMATNEKPEHRYRRGISPRQKPG